ncbi:hypothetical protein CBS63078_9193 [Aspergillus niger]|nr:hypothetical protein CBS13152_9476 [Aspergillus niger]KAI2891931.1 hypothetical protein CBS11852_5938 [Aspergillus niger]KAI2893152.1 hypothetical protein CBS63078_9193 [Aspergillus niger]KAI3020697.1 hypothetical protein CBS147347_8378 [Aspergillus niger]KAI3036729.1 hypothetical protein CBS76997_9699 [Aspergillus niger]
MDMSGTGAWASPSTYAGSRFTISTSPSTAAVNNVAPSTTMSSSMLPMSNAFHLGLGDPLWATLLTPKSKLTYAAAIIVLALMATALRFLVNIAPRVERCLAQNQRARESAWPGPEPRDNTVPKRQSPDPEHARTSVRWRAGVDIPRAAVQVVTTSMVYLLMIAVMTSNLAYLFAILCGTFVGELAFGRFKERVD